MYMIEWQKRGPPHLRNSIWLADKIQPTHIDDISAELPDPTQDPELFGSGNEKHDPRTMWKSQSQLSLHEGRKSAPRRKKKTPWPQSTSELYRLSDHRLSVKSVPTFLQIEGATWSV
jgi:hypothetical protein